MNQLSNLLVVDPDPRGLETLTYGFERAGCTVAGTSDPNLAPDLLRTTSPQLAVVSLRAPEKAGLDVITGIKRGAPVRRVPIVAVGAPALRQAALAAGTNDFVSTPLFVRDVINVGRLLTLSHPVPNAPQPEVEVQARLSEYHGLFYLLRALAVTGRSAIVLINRGNKRAELRVADGAVMAVHVAGLQGLPALHQLLLWEEAAISLKFRAVPKRSNLHMSAQELLDECERFLRDFAHAARDLGAPRAIYVPSERADASGLQPSQAGPALRLFDGNRILTEVIEESPFRVFDTLRVVKRLIESGAIVVKSDGAPSADEPRSMLEHWTIVPDDRGVVGGDKKRPSRKLRTLDGGYGDEPVGAPMPEAPSSRAFNAPTPGSTRSSGPILLTQKKPGVIGGEITPKRTAPRPTPASLSALGDAPTVQVRLDSLPPATSMAPSDAPPITARGLTPQSNEPPARRVTPAPSVVVKEVKDPLRKTPAPPGSLRDSGGRPSLDAMLSGPDSKNKLKKVLSGARLTPSTAFDAVEADFFAREADLYKREDVEDFGDLDRGRPKRKG
ncbi:MAG TPA: response regulator [Polyangia bacterium]|nr:response regulator [Polyangia bacterium]